MYGDIPLILQGAAQREVLSTEQLYRLESQGIPTQGASVNVSSVFLPLAFGVAAAFFLAGGSRRRSLWLLACLFASPLAAWPLRANAQTPFQKEVVSGSDTLTVYGTYTTTVTIDSVVKKFTPPPVTVGRPYGPSGLLNTSPPYAPFTADPAASSNRPQLLLDNIAKARARNIKFIATLPCGAHSVTNLGGCLAVVNGVIRFSKARFDSAMATYNTPAVRTAVAKAYADSVLIGVHVMDEPWVIGGGDGNTWGPVPLSRALVDTLCMVARAALGNVPIGTSDQIAWARSGPRKFCDIGIAQFSYRFGQPAAWRDSVLALSTTQGYQSVFAFNIVNGGTQDRDGTWDCAQQGGVKGTRSPNCTMTPPQTVAAGTTLGASGCGSLMMWRYDAPRFAKPGFPAAFQSVATLQAQRSQTVCRVR